jgi:branched-chain amino acid transport system ATP-binding protein
VGRDRATGADGPVAVLTSVRPAEGRVLAALGVSVQFDGLTAVEDVTLELHSGEIVGLIGPNGAGKTTLLNVLTGFQRPTTGEVFLDGEAVTSWSSARRARSGLVRTFQGARLFGDLTVSENVEAAVVSCTGLSRRAAQVRVADLLEYMELGDAGPMLASSLPHGGERRLGVARALATHPRFLLLDEPAAGLSEQEGREFGSALRRIQGELDLGLLVVEHDIALILDLCTRIHVLDHGRTIADERPDEIRANQYVREAYLGIGRN